MKIAGMNVRVYPTYMNSKFEQLLVLAICVFKHPGCYKVYAGIVEDTSLTNPTYREDNAGWICDQGTPLRYEEAIMHFPTLTKEQYG